MNLKGVRVKRRGAQVWVPLVNWFLFFLDASQPNIFFVLMRRLSRLINTKKGGAAVSRRLLGALIRRLHQKELSSEKRIIPLFFCFVLPSPGLRFFLQHPEHPPYKKPPHPHRH